MATEADACRALAAAVLALAIHDATRRTRDARGGYKADIPDVAEQADARSFCLTADGEWAEWRNFWCEMADVHPEVYRAHARRIIHARDRIIATHSKGVRAYA